MAVLNRELGTVWRDADVPEFPPGAWRSPREVLEEWAKQAKTALQDWSEETRSLLERWRKEKPRAGRQ